MPPDRRLPRAPADLVLVLAGFCLVVLQFFVFREVTALLHGTELVFLLVTLAYFSGYSVGYALAGRVSSSSVPRLALLAWALHLTLPFSFRYVGAALTTLASGVALAGLLFLTAFVLSSFYSVLLPRFIDEASDEPAAVVRCYGLELLGAIAGVATVAVLAARSPGALAVCYQAGLAAIVALLWGRRLVWGLALTAVMSYGLAFSVADRHSAAHAIAVVHGFVRPVLLHSENTFYQRVDIVRAADGQRYLYLGGRLNYGSPQLERFNVMLAELPAVLLRPREALIVGSGSMASVKAVSSRAGRVTTVELDPGVIAASRAHLSDINQLDELRNWTLVTDDVKSFLGSSVKTFDLIVMDVPAPTTVQLGLLHSVEFYELVRARLAPGGMISVSLSGDFSRGEAMPVAVAAALVRVFPEVLVYAAPGTGRSFAVGGRVLPFSTAALRAAAAALGADELVVHEGAALRAGVVDARPMTLDDTRLAVSHSWQQLRRLLAPEASR